MTTIEVEKFNLTATIHDLTQAIMQHIQNGNSHTAMLKTAELHGKLAVLNEFERMETDGFITTST